MTTARTAGRLASQEVDRFVALAAAAPSVLNTQPWHFRAKPSGIFLYAEPQRRLGVLDPRGRQMILSCGAALLNLRLGVRESCREPTVRLFPRADNPELLALVTLGAVRGATPGELDLVRSIPQRHTNRRPFNPEPPAAGLLAALSAAAEDEGAFLDVLAERDVGQVAALVATADERQRADDAVVAELARWTRGRRDDEGLPPGSLGPVPSEPGALVRDFGTAQGDVTTGRDGRATSAFESAPTVAVLSTPGDDRRDWMSAGQALQRVLLTATSAGLAASFLTQPLEIDELRERVRRLAASGGAPQMILRLGYAPPAPETPRRPLPEVLDKGPWH